MSQSMIINCIAELIIEVLKILSIVQWSNLRIHEKYSDNRRERKKSLQVGKVSRISVLILTFKE